MDEAFLHGTFQKFSECSKLYNVQVSRTNIVYYEKQAKDSSQRKPDSFTSILMCDVIGSKVYQSKIPNDTSGYFKITTFKKTNKKGARSMQTITFRVTDSDDVTENIAIAEVWARTLSWIIHDESLSVEDLEGKEEFPPSRRFLVLINPKSGPGKSIPWFNQKLKPLLLEAHVTFKSIITTHAGHATEIARDLDLNEWDTVVISSGDGMVHEVVNGFMQRVDWEDAIKTPLGIYPTGSGNGLAASLMYVSKEQLGLLSSAAYILLRGQPKPLDMFRLDTPKRKLYGFLGVTWGIVSDVDIESERYRALGDARFTLGAIQRIIGLRSYKGKFSYLPAPAGKRRPADRVSMDKLVNKHRQEEKSNSSSGGDGAFSSASSNDDRVAEDLAEKVLHNLDSSASDHTERRYTVGEISEPAVVKLDRAASSLNDVPVEPMANVSTSTGTPVYGPPQQLPTLDTPLPDTWVTIDSEFITIFLTTVSHIGYDLFPVPCQPLGAGCMSAQFIHKGVSRRKMLNLFLSLESGGHLSHPDLNEAEITAFRLEPSMDRVGYIAVDGEVVEYGPVQAELFQGMARVISLKRQYVP